MTDPGPREQPDDVSIAADVEQNDCREHQRGFLCGVVEGFYGKPWSCSQRRHLVRRLKEFKMNTFMYGPKDDAKHRAKWRDRYNDREAQQLKELIDEAASNGIDFYYALAPGLDMVYSNDEDAMKICDKFSQLRDLGCKSFALLFDDIEPSVTNQKDRAVFNDNYALAQVLITNVVYDYLGKPNFLFCPTEYCESRAVPNVPDSNYLNIIGSGLHRGIDIMWSGSRVVSRSITEESIEELTKVIRRPPVIWENLHANDYDRKRVYLGPFSGRSTKLIPKLRGILTNPNCEYEANHIAIHTLAQWSRCNHDINPLNRCNQANREPITSVNKKHDHSMCVYDPEDALRLAIQDWLPHLRCTRPLSPGGREPVVSSSSGEAAAMGQLAKESNVDQVDMDSGQLDKRLQDDSESTDEDNLTLSGHLMDSSPMGSSDGGVVIVDMTSCESCEMQDVAPTPDGPLGHLDEKESQQKPPSLDGSASRLDLDSLALLVDFFYLPFEHGPQGHAFLRDIKWLMDNSRVFMQQQSDVAPTAASANLEKKSPNEMAVDEQENQRDIERLIESWQERQHRIESVCSQVIEISSSLLGDCPNKPLVAELGPYLSDLIDMMSFIGDFVRFLRRRKSSSDRLVHPYTSERLKQGGHMEACTDEQEPWVHRGGLIGDVHRLICSGG